MKHADKIQNIDKNDWFILTEICNYLILQLKIKYSKKYFLELRSYEVDPGKLSYYNMKRGYFRNLLLSNVFDTKELMFSTITKYYTEFVNLKD